MADPLVLASLSVDATGVVSGIGASNRALGQGETQLDKFGRSGRRTESMTSSLANKFFSLRSAATSLTRVLGIAGLITGIALAMKTLIGDMITSATWFQRTRDAVVDWTRALLAGEDAVGRLGRKIKDSGIASVAASDLAKLRELVKLREDLVKAQTTMTPEPSETISTMASILTLGGLGAKPKGALGERLKPDESVPAAGKALALEIDEVTRNINKLIRELTLAGVSLEEISDATGAKLRKVPMSREELAQWNRDQDAMMFAFEEANKHFRELAQIQEFKDFFGPETRTDIFDMLGIPTPMEFQHTMDLVGEAVSVLRQELASGSLDANQFALGMQNLLPLLQSLGLTASEAEDKLRGLGVELAKLQEFTFLRGLKDLEETLTVASAQFELFQIGVNSAADAITGALVGTNVKGKQAMAALLADMSRMLIVYALMFTAMGIAASTGAGAAILAGTPSQFFKAAAGFAAAGVAAGLASRALGGPRGGAEGGGGGGGAGGAGFGAGESVSRREQSITLIVQGSMIGTDPDNLARDIARLLRTAETDGGA